MTENTLPSHPRFRNLLGKTFGKLRVLSYAGMIQQKRQRTPSWNCLCECGSLTVKTTSGLTARKRPTTSCGCVNTSSKWGNQTPSASDQKLPSHPHFKNITGFVFGRLTVISFVEMRQFSSQKVAVWRCQCACGQTKDISASSLRFGGSNSCGCLQREIASKASSNFQPSHGLTGTPEWEIWSGMRERCNNPGSISFSRYGARGISVCERWSDFSNFLADMGERPSKSHSIDRINGDGNYEPGNCRWATKSQQARNRRDNVKVMFNGELRTTADIADEIGIPRSVLNHRKIILKWSDEKIVSTPLRITKRTTIANRSSTPASSSATTE